MATDIRIVDLQSDTRTKPTPEMRRAMAEAEVGDEGYGDDPTLNRLEAMAAEMLGTEAAILVSSGSMGNLVAALNFCARGDQMILGHRAHTLIAEMGSSAAHGGIVYRTVPSNERGMMDLDAVDLLLHPRDEPQPHTGLIEMENTHGSTGGRVISVEETRAVVDLAHRNSVPVHIDGARFFNAVTATGATPIELSGGADTVTFCLSKGLSAPFGSMLCGTREDMARARVIKKSLGGGLRQSGIMAAAGIVALETMIDRLADDHENASTLAKGLARLPGVVLNPEDVETNQVYFGVTFNDQDEINRVLTERGVQGLILDEGWRFVTHSGVDADDIEYALGVIGETFSEFA
jgi:threonine aldolase